MIDPANIKVEPMNPDSTTGNAPKKKPGRPKKMKQEKITEHVTVKKKRKVDRFKGMSEEEVLTRLLPDHLAPNLDIVIVGINPGLYAAFVGHHYAGPGNHFWKCLYLSGLIPEQMNAMQDSKLLDYGIGFTNIVSRTSRGSADLSKKEIKQGAEILTEKLLKYRPKIAVFNGKGIYEVFVGHKNFYFGKQPEPLPGTDTAVFVMPSSSARCSQLPRAVDKVPFYAALKKFRDHINGNLPDLKESEITFPDLELKTAKKEPKQEPGAYPGEFDPNMQMQMAGENGLSQFMSGQYQFMPHNGSLDEEISQSSSSQHSLPHENQRQGTMPYTSQGPVTIKREPVDSMNGSSSRNGSPNVVQIKQEPGTFDGSCSSQDFVKIKQEPGTTDSSCPVSQPDRYVQPTQPGSQGGGGGLDFLGGLYGLVNQVASQQAGSAYGLVSSRSRPLQFNDALCGIVRDDCPIDLELVSQSNQMQSAESSDSQPQGKKAKQKNRKTKAGSSVSQTSSSSPSSTLSMTPDMSHCTPPPAQTNSIPACQPVQPFTQYLPNNTQHNPSFTTQPYTTYGNMPYFPHPPVTAYSQPYPTMVTDYQPHQSFTQLMNMSDDFGHFTQGGQGYNGMIPAVTQGNMSQNTYHNGQRGPPSSDIYNPNMHIKQEKSDS